MQYIDVQWIHSNSDDPVRLISELDPDRFEIRKIELWSDGRVGYASKAVASRGTRLGIAPVPSVGEINEQSVFAAREIDAVTFEQLWTIHVPA